VSVIPASYRSPDAWSASEFARGPVRVKRRSKGGAHMGILWIVLIVILVLVLLGYLGRGRLS
jgi:hypothetical protein